MNKFFVPYICEDAASVEVNGHRVLILGTDQEDRLEELEVLGADDVREIETDAVNEDEIEFFSDLAQSINGGVVLAPPGESFVSVIEDLQDELPWLH